MPFRLEHSYTQLPPNFYTRVRPTPVAHPRWLAWNSVLAQDLGLDLVADDEAFGLFSGNHLPSGVDPIATVYAGHQFGNLVPQLGDGRAILLGEITAPNGLSYEIQLKGAGPTPYSRRGDGRAAIGPVLREYLVSEAMAAMGVPTTRALSAIATGEAVYRQEVLPGAILTRVSRSHVRIGTFEFFAMRGDTDGLLKLTDFVIARLYPHIAAMGSPPQELLAAVIAAQAELVAHWMALGFVHGVMNTDNMAISGETIDYGPCAFLDTYRPDRCFSSIDTHGRYAYQQQPPVALWNLTRLAETLLPVMVARGQTQEVAIATLQELLKIFMPLYQDAYMKRFGAKVGLRDYQEGDAKIVQDLLHLMAQSGVDFTVAFSRLTDVAGGAKAELFTHMFKDDAAHTWLQAWQTRFALGELRPEERWQAMRLANPRVIPRNHQIEHAIAAAMVDDLEPFRRLHARLKQPFDDLPADGDEFALPPGEEQWTYRTFCGT